MALVWSLICVSGDRLAWSQNCSSEQPAPIDFREHAAPPEVHILASPKLFDELELANGQQDQLRQTLQDWETEYRKRKAEIDALPPNDLQRSRGWPPTRDRQLHAAILETLNPEQELLFQRMTAVWNNGPVRSSDAFRFDDVLHLSAEQHRQLHALDVRWNLSAMPQLADVDIEPGLSGRIEFHRAIAAEAWKFQPERDVAWQKILTADQARAWQQQELRRWLKMDPMIVLNTFQGKEPKTLPRTGTYADYLVPYFRPPALVLDWTKEQQARIAEILEAPGSVTVEEISQIQDRDARIAAYQQLSRQWIRRLSKVEELMTDAQKAKWDSLVGENWLAVLSALYEQ